MMFMNGEYVKTIEDLKPGRTGLQLLQRRTGNLASENWGNRKGRPITAYPERQCLSSCSAVCSIWMESRTFR